MSLNHETVEQAAAAAARRWRTIAVGLAVVGATNLANAAMNAATLTQQPVVCVAAINDPRLAEQAIDQRVDQHRGGFSGPRR